MTNEINQGRATNEIVQPDPDGGNGGGPHPYHPTGWTWTVVVIAAIGIFVWMGRKLKANTAAFEKLTEDELVDAVLDAVAKDVPGRVALRQELTYAVAGRSTLRNGPLADILRIEESYEKHSAGRYHRRIAVLRRKDGTTGSLIKIESEVGWEYIPEGIREQFIKTRESKVVRLVYDAGKEAGS